MARALLVLGSLLCVFFLSFQKVCFPWAGTHFILTVRSNLSAEGGAQVCCHRARPSGRGGRQELDKIVCRQGLYRLNVGMIEGRK